MSDEEERNEDIESTASSERHSNREFTSLLLSLYQEAPELWKVKSKHYYDKNKKALAITKITNALKVLDRNFTEDDLKKKINKLRTSFNRELKKKKESMKSGSGADEIYIPKLWYFNEMSFLLDSVDIAATQSSEDLQGSSEDTGDRRAIGSSNKQKKKRADDVQVELLNLATSYFSNKEEDEYDVMGKAWATQMRQLRADQKVFARKIINDVLFEGAMGTLTRHGVNFLHDASSITPVNTSNTSCSSDSTYTSPIPPQSPVPRRSSKPNNPPIYSSSLETTDYIYSSAPSKPILMDKRSATNTPNIDHSPMANTSSASNYESPIFPHHAKCYTPRHSSARNSSLKKSSKSPRSTVLRHSLVEQYKSSALNEYCQLNEDYENYDLIQPQDLNLTSNSKFSTVPEVEEAYTAAEYLKNFSNI